MIVIYKITNPENKIYLGCTINWSRRLNGYKKLRVKGQPLIHSDLARKYNVSWGTIKNITDYLEGYKLV